VHLQPGHLSGRNGDAQRVGAVGDDVIQVEPDLTCRWNDGTPYLPAKWKRIETL
jgi:hypothetical protein